MILFAQFYHHLSIKMQQKDIKSISYGNYKHQVGRFKRRTRGLQTPHAGIAISARGVFNASVLNRIMIPFQSMQVSHHDAHGKLSWQRCRQAYRRCLRGRG